MVSSANHCRVIEQFDFEATEINETLIRDLASGGFLDHQRNLVLIGGTGTGKTHPLPGRRCTASSRGAPSVSRGPAFDLGVEAGSSMSSTW